MIRSSLFIFSLFCFSLYTYAQVTDAIFKKQWAEIDSLLLEKGLPKSALQKVNNVYIKAKALNQKDEAIKALLYRMSIEQQVIETDINQQINTVEKEIVAANDVAARSILQAILANVYQSFLNENSFRVYQRSKTTAYKKTDVNSWSADDFDKAITQLYNEALQPSASLQQQTISAFKASL
jgi:hypothetical protein